MEVKTDRELLELAAKAAGYVVNFGDFACNSRETEYWMDSEGRGCYWNPLADDGDAFRLAMKLGLEVTAGRARTMRNTFEEWGDNYRADPLAATRRAIVRAAAELARKGAE